QRAKRAVVNIHTVKTANNSNTIFGTTKHGKINGMGTGIVFDERGYVVTNNHVIVGVDSLEVSLVDGSRYPAHVINFDRKHDLAIIKIDGNPDLEVMPFGTSSDLMLGETVIAVGNAFGYVHTVTSGIVSALSRDVEVDENQKYKNLIQTDASINPGNSGGPLLNLNGEVIGINVAIRAGAQRIGFAIPIDEARVLISQIFNIQILDQNYHGLATRDKKSASVKELIVAHVAKGSPADKAGFETGDVITHIGQTAIVDAVDLERSLLGRDPDSIPCVVMRDGVKEELMLSLTQTSHSNSVAAMKSSKRTKTVSYEDDSAWDVLGMKLAKLPESQKGKVGPRYRGGMIVKAVRPNSPAAKSGIRNADILVGLNVWETVNDENITFVMDHPKLNTFNPLKFFILRKGETLYGHLKFKDR
ncbi:MAG: trypsin-like peptidase domain-containing protein, partial [Planctomycetaceae bacterium]|nr:trypsin-like peptidase domain-containing protein [Planctomycetaceae bacterium]